MKPLSQKTKMRISAVVVGNGLEFFDYMVYIHLLIVLTPLFFPNKDPLTAKLMAYSTLLISYVVTPLGGALLGYIGDNFGRIISMSLSLLLMGIASFIFCILPTHASAGIWATSGLLLARVLQCFAASGEDVGTSVFLVEESPPQRVCAISSLVEVSGCVGALLGLSLGYLSMSLQPVDGWRYPFLAGGVLAVVGFWMRTHLTETKSFRRKRKKSQPAYLFYKDIFKNHTRNILCVVGLSAPGFAAFHLTYFYLPDVLSEDFSIPISNILGQSALLMVVDILVILVMSRIADVVGYKKMLNVVCYAMLILVFPLFFLMNSLKNFTSVVIVQLVLIFLSDVMSVALRPFVVSLFPVVGRYTAYAISWNAGCLLFRGIGSFACLYLKKSLGIMGPSLYLILAAFVFWISLHLAKPCIEETEADDSAADDFVAHQEAA